MHLKIEREKILKFNVIKLNALGFSFRKNFSVRMQRQKVIKIVLGLHSAHCTVHTVNYLTSNDSYVVDFLFRIPVPSPDPPFKLNKFKIVV